MSNPTPAEWDAAAAAFDEEPDHGLRDPAVRDAWQRLLLPLLPSTPADVVDLGTGTGSLAVLLAEAGHRVRGLDTSPGMLAVAAAKAQAAGVSVSLTEGDAARPPFEAGSCDAVVVRHVLWALQDPGAALRRWTSLLRPDGRLVLVEGRWSTGAGISAARCRELVLAHRETVTVRQLGDPALWGGPVTDERYLLVSTS